MTENNYIIFKRFQTREESKEYTVLLEKHNIDYKVINSPPPFDTTYSGNSLKNEFQLNIRQTDFDKVNLILEAEAEKSITQIDKSHYLFEFSNEELYDLILKSDEWSPLDVKLAERILIERGKPVDKDLIKSLKKQRLEDLSNPEEGQKTWIYMGYFTAFIGGLIGVFIGWHLSSFKKTLPNGQKVYAYNENDRKQGKRILYIGALCFVFWTSIQIWQKL